MIVLGSGVPKFRGMLVGLMQIAVRYGTFPSPASATDRILTQRIVEIKANRQFISHGDSVSSANDKMWHTLSENVSHVTVGSAGTIEMTRNMVAGSGIDAE